MGAARDSARSAQKTSSHKNAAASSPEENRARRSLSTDPARRNFLKGATLAERGSARNALGSRQASAFAGREPNRRPKTWQHHMPCGEVHLPCRSADLARIGLGQTCHVASAGAFRQAQSTDVSRGRRQASNVPSADLQAAKIDFTRRAYVEPGFRDPI